MRYRAVAGHSDKELHLVMECSGCGINLRTYIDAIEKLKLKYCPECGRKLVQRKSSIPYAKIVDMLNKEGGNK